MNLRLVTAILLIHFSVTLHAQTSSPAIRVLAKVKSNDVWLRWAPTNFTVWELGNKYGYTLERYRLKIDGNLESKEPVRLTSASIKPFSKEEFETLSQITEEAKVIEELIYNTEGKNNGSAESSPAEILKKQEESTNRFGIALLICDLKPVLAIGAGLFFNDTTAVKGARYIYKISLATNPSTIKTEPGVIVTDVTESKPLQPFNDLQATFGDKTVTLSWSTFTHTGIYSAYIIEKSQDGSAYKPVTDLPYIPMSESAVNEEVHFVDSLKDNTITFHYRVKGITPFGEEGPPSNIVSGTGKDNVTGLIILREVKREDKKISIQWEYPLEHENKINGFMIGKATKAEGPYKDITSKVIQKNNRTFSEIAPLTSAYYQVRALDAKGTEVTHSLPYFLHTEDNVPPGVPSGLSGSVNLKGVVTLTWKPTSDADLQGYRVFSSNSLREEFVEITREIVTKPSFSDTLNTSVLNKKIFYKAISVDRNFNTSDYSTPLTLSRPDLIPPAPPAFSKADKKENTIELGWINSASNDVARYVLYRTSIRDTTKINIFAWRTGRPEISYSDNSIPEGNTYRYHLYAYDSAGNFSMATSKEIKYESGIRKALDDLTAIIDRENKNITLKWSYDVKAKSCLLYRKKNDEPFSLYQTLEGSSQKFIDNQVTPNTIYSYKIQLVLETNAKTQLSKELKVPF